jgi:CBS domain-containing protein
MLAFVPEQSVLARIEDAADVKALRCIRELQHGEWLMQLPESDGGDWNAKINGVHDAFIRRVVAIAEKKLAEQGEGTPPVPYVFVLFGSGGRSEQTLCSDQDNGLIYADSGPVTMMKADVYFQKLASEIGKGLLELGYPPCSGDVLCSNRLWRQPLSGWIRTVQEWLHNRSWENVRYLLVIADMRPIYGESVLAMKIAEELRFFVRDYRISLKELLANTVHRKVCLTPFGRLVTERYGEDAGGVDIKYGCYIPFVNAVRLLALQRDLYASTTLGRIAALQACGEISDNDAGYWTDAFKRIIKFRAQTPIQIEDGAYQTRGKLTAGQLTRQSVRELKLCLRAGREAAKHVHKSVANELAAVHGKNNRPSGG